MWESCENAAGIRGLTLSSPRPNPTSKKEKQHNGAEFGYLHKLLKKLPNKSAITGPFLALIAFFLPFFSTAQTIRFEPNRGQWPQPVQFMADIPGGRLFLEPDGWTYLFWDEAQLEELHEKWFLDPELGSVDWPLDAHAVKVRLPKLENELAGRAKTQRTP